MGIGLYPPIQNAYPQASVYRGTNPGCGPGSSLSGVSDISSRTRLAGNPGSRTQKVYAGSSLLISGYGSSGRVNENLTVKNTRTQEMRDMLRGLKKEPQKKANPYAAYSEDYENGFLMTSRSSDDDGEDSLKEPVNYNYKEVASKIQRAKTSVSASQAVLSARRKVIEMKRKISAGNGDAEELQLALTHAKKMEMTARKKKHHLELEELAERTRGRDEQADRQEDAVSGVKDALISLEEEKVSEKEDEILKEREEMIREAAEELEESRMEEAEEALAALNEEIAEFGEDELKELEEAMELLETMEVIDPHMSEEELEELKRKHRNAENKAIMKADMDYLKGMIRHLTEKGTSPASGSASRIFSGAPAFAQTAAPSVSASVLPGVSPASLSGPVSVSVDLLA